MTGNRLWGAVTVLLIVAIVGLGWLLGASPLLTQATAADDERASIEAQNAAQEAQLVLMKEQFENLPELEKELDELRTSIPDVAALDDFFDAANGLASATGATIVSITASEAQEYGATAADPSAAAPVEGEAPAITPMSGVYTIPITITLKSPPDQVTDFVRYLQAAKRLFLINSVNFTGGTEVTGAVSGYLFVIVDPSAPAPGPSVPAAPAPTPSTTPEPTPTPTETPTG